MADEGTFAALATGLARLLEPLEERVQADGLRALLSELGLTFPPAIDGDAALAAAGQTAVQRLESLEPIITELSQAAAAEDAFATIAASLKLADTVTKVIGDATALANAIRALPGTGIPQPELDAFADELPGRLIEYLVVRNLEGVPGAAQTLDLIGAVERVPLPQVDPAHPAFVRRALHVQELTSFLSDPAQQLRTKYQWGDPAFDGTALLQKVNALLADAGVPAILDTSGPVPVLDAVAFEVSPKLDDPMGLRIVDRPRRRRRHVGTVRARRLAGHGQARRDRSAWASRS